MGERIDLNANDATMLCASSLERMKDPFRDEIRMRSEPIYDLVGASKEDRFVFTSSGAEGVNQVLFSVFLEVSRKTGKCHFVTSAIEDAPTMQMMKRLEDLGCFVKIAPVDEKGQIDLEKLRELIGPRTALVSVSMAQGLTGVIQPFEEIGKIAKEKGTLLHFDASQTAGKIYFSFKEIDADYLTFSGHLIHSAHGSGALFAKKGVPLVPLILGGGDLRGGPFDFSSFSALAAAASQASLYLDRMSLEVVRLRDLFEKEISRLFPDARIIYKDSFRLPNTTVIEFPKAHREALHFLLQKKGIETSIGGNYSQHLHRLTFSESAISFSLSRMTTEKEIRLAAEIICKTASYLGSISEGVFDGV